MNSKSTIVLKVGSSSVISQDESGRPKLAILSHLVECCQRLRLQGHRVAIVSSGAIATGRQLISQSDSNAAVEEDALKRNQDILVLKQAAASIGQIKLMSMYDTLFGLMKLPIAQVLLTRSDVCYPHRYKNASSTLLKLLELGVIPIINENDALSVTEIKFGDNDSLSAIAAAMIKADYLFLLTDVACLYTDNPLRSKEAKPIKRVVDVDTDLAKVNVGNTESLIGTGGMITKIVAAKIAVSVGVDCIVMSSESIPQLSDVLLDIGNGHVDGNLLYTHFVRRTVNKTLILDRKWWIKYSLHKYGCLYVDQKSYQNICSPIGGSLFATGVYAVEGSFHADEAVTIKLLTDAVVQLVASILAMQHSNNDVLQLIKEQSIDKVKDVACGLSNFSSSEIARLVTVLSKDIPSVLGYMSDFDCIIHRNNLVINEYSPQP